MKTYIFDINPVGKPRMTQSDKWKRRPATTQYWQFKDELVKTTWINRFKMKDTLDVVFYIPMPPSWSKKKRMEMVNKPHQQKPDTDNLIKAFVDALCPDDSFIWDKRGRKFWSEKGRIEVHV